MRGLRAVLGTLVLVACAAERKPNGTFSNEDPGKVRPYLVLKAEGDTSARNWPGIALHVALMAGTSEADQRATLQHVIDSVAAKETAALWLRVTGFAPGPMVPGKLEADLLPVLQAIWAPPDTNDPAAHRHDAVHHISFTVIPLPADASKKR